MGSLVSKLIRTFAVLVVVAIVSLGLMQMYVSNSLASSGQQVQSLEQERQALELENEQLSNQLVELKSLSRVAEASGRLGMVQPTKVMYAKTSQPIAMGGQIR